jgi:hypothetical protein
MKCRVARDCRVQNVEVRAGRQVRGSLVSRILRPAVRHLAVMLLRDSVGVSIPAASFRRDRFSATMSGDAG